MKHVLKFYLFFAVNQTIENFCTIENPCGEDLGDCDSDDECQNNLFCGYNNCPLLGTFVDCCSKTQYIMSTNYPSSYPTYETRTWDITAPFGLLINLQFHAFNVSIIYDLSTTNATDFENWWEN